VGKLPLVVATLTLATSFHGAVDRRVPAHAIQDVIYGLAGRD
jgi:hypothetical protein